MSRINTFSWHRIQIKTLFTAVNTGNILSRDVEDGSGYDLSGTEKEVTVSVVLGK